MIKIREQLTKLFSDSTMWVQGIELRYPPVHQAPVALSH